MAKESQKVEAESESSESLMDLDTFMSVDNVEPVWINGLMVYLASRGGLVSRSQAEWRSILKKYQGLK